MKSAHHTPFEVARREKKLGGSIGGDVCSILTFIEQVSAKHLGPYPHKKVRLVGPAAWKLSGFLGDHSVSQAPILLQATALLMISL